MTETATASASIGPDRAFRFVARAEAVTWALLLVGMFLKYVTETTDLAVTVFGMAHGVVFLAFVVVTAAVALDQQWGARRAIITLTLAIPPLLTLIAEKAADLGQWNSSEWRVIKRPGLAALLAVGAVVLLTGGALLVGPPF